MTHALDLFAGTGWGVALQRLGISEDGVEIMPEANATRAANGMRTAYEDVWEGLLSDAHEVPYDLLIASPPCQTFSMAGSGKGRQALDEVLAAIADGAYQDAAKLHALAELTDPKTALVLTPLAHVWRDWPDTVIFEQVPPVLPVWEACAEVMRSMGYSVWVGILNAEQYGVPQTRRRAILIARMHGEAKAPTPTHSKFYPRDKTRLDPGVAKWVSMAEALGWGMTKRPYPTVTTGTEGGGTDPGCLGGSGARRTVTSERAAGDWQPGEAWSEGEAVVMRSNYGTSDDPAARGEFPASEPARTITSKADRNMWVHERPATTVQGDSRIWPPGHKVNAADEKRLGGDEARARYGDRAGTTAIRVTETEAALLQSYPAEFEWCGNKGRRFEQIGNAVPPLLAEAVIAAALA